MNPNYKEWNWHEEYTRSETPPSHKRVQNTGDNNNNDYPLEMVKMHLIMILLIVSMNLQKY